MFGYYSKLKETSTQKTIFSLVAKPAAEEGRLSHVLSHVEKKNKSFLKQ